MVCLTGVVRPWSIHFLLTISLDCKYYWSNSLELSKSKMLVSISEKIRDWSWAEMTSWNTDWWNPASKYLFQLAVAVLWFTLSSFIELKPTQWTIFSVIHWMDHQGSVFIHSISLKEVAGKIFGWLVQGHLLVNSKENTYCN